MYTKRIPKKQFEETLSNKQWSLWDAGFSCLFPQHLDNNIPFPSPCRHRYIPCTQEYVFFWSKHFDSFCSCVAQQIPQSSEIGCYCIGSSTKSRELLSEIFHQCIKKRSRQSLLVTHNITQGTVLCVEVIWNYLLPQYTEMPAFLKKIRTFPHNTENRPLC